MSPPNTLTVWRRRQDFEDGICVLLLDALRIHGSGGQRSGHDHINPILAKEVDATLNRYLAPGLIQHSTSRYPSPLVVIPKKSGGVRITVNYEKLNQISKLSKLPIPRVDQVLDSLGSGRVFSLFDLVSSFHQIKAPLGYSSPYSVLHTRRPLRVARYASEQQRLAWVVRQGHQ